MRTKFFLFLFFSLSVKLMAIDFYNRDWKTYIWGSDDNFLYEPDAVKGYVAVRTLYVYSGDLQYGALPKNSEIEYRISYFYNNKGKIMASTINHYKDYIFCYYNYDKITGLLNSKQYFYFLQGIPERTPYKEIYYKYDTKKRLTDIVYSYSANESTKREITKYAYEKQGIVTQYAYNSDGNLSNRYQNFYQNGKLTRSVWTHVHAGYASLVEEIKVEYNKQGHVSHEYSFVQKYGAKSAEHRYYKYEFDKQGNWTYRLRYPAKTKDGGVAAVDNVRYEWIRATYEYAETADEREKIVDKVLKEEINSFMARSKKVE